MVVEFEFEDATKCLIDSDKKVLKHQSVTIKESFQYMEAYVLEHSMGADAKEKLETIRKELA